MCIYHGRTDEELHLIVRHPLSEDSAAVHTFNHAGSAVVAVQIHEGDGKTVSPVRSFQSCVPMGSRIF